MRHGRVIVSSTNRLFREGLRHVLAEIGLQIVGEANTLDHALSQSRSLNCSVDIIVHDQDDSQRQDVDVLKEIRRDFPEIGIVILAESADFEGLNIATEGGAKGFLPKSISSTALGLTLQLILLGENLFASPVALAGRRSTAIRAVVSDSTEPRLPLSSREKEVLDCLGLGAPNKLIARKLGMAEATVKVHIKSVLRKIEVSNRTQAAIWTMSRRSSIENSVN